MVKVILNNSYSQITGLNTTQFNKLRKILSYKDNAQVSYFAGGFNRPKYLLDKKGYFPTGLYYPYVRDFLKDISFYYESEYRVCPQTTPGLFKLDPALTFYKWQIDAADRADEQDRGGIVATTGSGKSRLMALIASRLNVRTLIVVPSIEIKHQLQAAIDSMLTYKPGSIVILNIDSPLLETAKDFDCLIIDECHHAAAKTYQRLNKTAWANIYYRFFLSATFFRNQENEHLLFEGIAGQVIYELTYKEARDLGIVVPVEAYYIDLPKREVKGYTWQQVYNEIVVNNEYRNSIISNLLETLGNVPKSTLCLVKEIEHGNNLSYANFANGKDESSRRHIKEFVEGRLDVLIGTTSLLGEGRDTKPAEYLIIAGLGKAKSSFMQAVGRAVRTYPGKESAKIIIFRDPSHKWSLSHFNAQKKILLEVYGVKVLKL